MNLKPIVILSLALNVVLLGATGYFAKKSSATTSAAVEGETKTHTDTKIVRETKRGANTLTTVTNRVVQTVDWRNVESEDYRKYIGNLRSIGCPEETIRDIITADVNKLFVQRRRELTTGGKKFEFWKTGNPMAAMMDPEKMEKQQALNKEKSALLKELLGVEPAAETANMFAGMFETMLDFLPTDKQGKVTQLLQDAQVKIMKSMGKGGQPDADDAKQMSKVQKDLEADLAKILSPQEFEDYQLRMSQTAMVMRMQLASFDPNEDEFRKIFDVKKKFDDEYPMMGMGSLEKEEKKKMEADKKAMNEQLKSILGDRYADYERAEDWNYQNIYRIADKNGLGKDTAVKVYDMKKVAEDKAKEIRTNKTLTSEQRTAALKSIRDETEGSMRTTFGEKAYTSYEKQAYWLNSISPKANPAD